MKDKQVTLHSQWYCTVGPLSPCPSTATLPSKQATSKMTYDYIRLYCSLVFCCVLLFETHDTCTIIMYFFMRCCLRHNSHLIALISPQSLNSWACDLTNTHTDSPPAAAEILVLWLNTFLILPIVDFHGRLSQGEHRTSSFSLSVYFPGGNPGEKYHPGKQETMLLLLYVYFTLSLSYLQYN